MSVRRALLIIVGCGAAFAVMGGVLGGVIREGRGPLGVAQGLVVGASIGTSALLAYALCRPPRPAGLVALALLILPITTGVAGIAFGWVVGQLQSFEDGAQAQLDRIRAVLQDPRFAHVVAGRHCLTENILWGRVDSEDARRDLEARLRSLFGDEEARELVYEVEVAPSR